MKQVLRSIGRGFTMARGAPIIFLVLGVSLAAGMRWSPQVQTAMGIRGILAVVETATPVPTDTPVATDTPLPTAIPTLAATPVVQPTMTPIPAPDLVVSPSQQTIACTSAGSEGQHLATFTLTNTGQVGHGWNTVLNDDAFSVHPAVAGYLLAPGAAIQITVGGLAPSGTVAHLTILQGGRNGEEYSTVAVVTITCA